MGIEWMLVNSVPHTRSAASSSEMNNHLSEVNVVGTGDYSLIYVWNYFDVFIEICSMTLVTEDVIW